ncbi:MAG: recombinase [Flaviaesturariibacter sp.]|nr:recombinase [Flaviaesturariibacter sp.]
MLELLNIRFSFLCRTTHTNAEGKHPLVFRVIYRKERRDIFTGLYCEKVEWNSKTQRLHRLNKACISINDNLDLIERKGYEVFEAFRNRDREFTLDELMDKLQGKGDRPTLLMDYLEEEKEGLKKRLGVDITPATYDKYRRSASHVQTFLLTEYKVKNYALSRIDSEFLEKYFQYLRGTRGIGHNTSVK